jgi:hypothetical protein
LCAPEYLELEMIDLSREIERESGAGTINCSTSCSYLCNGFRWYTAFGRSFLVCAYN